MAPRKIYLQQSSGEMVLDEGRDKQYVLKLRDLPANEKPREKMIKYGSAALTLAELFAVILNVGTKKEEVLALKLCLAGARPIGRDTGLVEDQRNARYPAWDIMPDRRVF